MAALSGFAGLYAAFSFEAEYVSHSNNKGTLVSRPATVSLDRVCTPTFASTDVGPTFQFNYMHVEPHPAYLLALTSGLLGTQLIMSVLSGSVCNFVESSWD